MKRTIALLVADLTSSAAHEIAAGAESEAQAQGDLLLLITGTIEEKGPLLVGRADALLVASATASTSLPSALDGLPTVLVNRHEALPGLAAAVVVDDHAGIATATEHLLSLGHLRIAHIAGPQETDTARRRKQGFLDAIARAGRMVPSGYVIEAAFDERAGFAAMQTLLEHEQPPTAVVTSSVAVAVGAISAIHASGKRIPTDVSIVAYDEAPVAEFLEPPLTTIAMPLREVGAEAVRVAHALSTGGHADRLRVIDTPSAIIGRESTASPPADR